MKRYFFFCLLISLLFFAFPSFGDDLCPPGLSPDQCYLYLINNPPSSQTPPADCVPMPAETTVEVSDPFRCDDFSVYRCANNFCGNEDGAMEEATEWYMCQTTTYTWVDGCNDGSMQETKRVSGPYGPEDIRPYGKVPDYRKCMPSGNNWNPSPPPLECSGSCYPAPNLKPADDSSIFPKNISDSTGYKLPVNFGWKENVEEEVSQSDSFCHVGSYNFNMPSEGITENVSGNQLQEVSDNPYKLECRLKSGFNYQWKVQGCSDDSGADCGDWSVLGDIKTSTAPEPYLPYDIDWQGDSATNTALNEEDSRVLNWCNIENPSIYKETISDGEAYYKPLSYKILLYYSKDYACHKNLSVGSQCEPVILSPGIIPAPIEKFPPEEFTDNGTYFTKNTPYAWKVAACIERGGVNCTDYSQLWKFTTGEWDIGTVLTKPADDINTPVGLPVVLAWESEGANSYKYKVSGVKEGDADVPNVFFDYPELKLNTTYEWFAKACYDYDSQDCEDAWAGPWHFKTTGQAPKLNALASYNVPFPVNLSWQGVSGAKSYIVNVQGQGFSKDIVTEKATLSLGYPDLHQETTYTWKVKTCAKEGGTVCGSFSGSQSFTTFRMPVPPNLSPANNGNVYTGQRTFNLLWDSVPGARFYQYDLDFISPSPEETSQSCTSKNLNFGTIIEQLGTDPLDLRCLGTYQWRVRACMDAACQESGTWSNVSNFNLVEGKAPTRGTTIVPCGRTQDNPDTSWDERDDCQIKHIFLVVRNLVDFVLWTFGPIMLGFLVLGTGLMFYFAIKFQGSDIIVKIKFIWKAAAIGYGILFLSWTVLNFFLKLVGFQIGIFGGI